jgi:hypothetical protein
LSAVGSVQSRAFAIVTHPARKLEKLLAYVVLIGSVAYMIPFVSRGWIPHDEGMIGQSAERALLGQLPHVEFRDAYTGGLTWFYAAIFGAIGINLLYIRWALFAAAVMALIILYVILRRTLDPLAAAGAVAVAIGWSFPNYFAALPSWWVLVCALVCLWALARYYETRSLGYVAMAGLTVGVAVAIKQTGLYLVPPLLMSVWIGSDRTGMTNARFLPGDRALRVTLGILLLGAATLLLANRLWPGEVTYLLIPIAASSVAFSMRYDEQGIPDAPGVWLTLCLAGVSVALPVALLLIPYLATGHLREFFEGAFILPQRRLSFASIPMPSAWYVACGAVLVLCMALVPSSLRTGEIRVLQVVRWAAALVLVGLGLSYPAFYQFLWHSLRAILALSPLVALWTLASDPAAEFVRRRLLFATSSMLAWAALVQFPFSAPIYFCYVAPLGVIAIACAAGRDPRGVRRFAPLAGMALAFAILSMNRGYLGALGVRHAPVTLDAPLDQVRARLTADPGEAAVYKRTIFLVKNNLAGGGLMAGPDSPEIYFLTGQFSPTGAMFDFLDPGASSPAGTEALWLGASVVVINTEPDFSERIPDSLRSKIRQSFPQGEHVGPFEVRWR